MRLFRSLRGKFVLYVVGFVTTSMVLLSHALFVHEHEALSLELRKRLAVQVENVSVQAREALETNDDLSLVTSLRSLRSMEEFCYAAVVTDDGGVFAHSDVRRTGQALALPDTVHTLRRGVAFLNVRQGDEPPLVEVWTPIVSTLRGADERLGFVCLAVTQAPLLAAVDRAKLAAVRVGALFCVLGIIGTALIAGTITRPIGKLVHGVQRIAAGDLEHKVNLRRGDEIGLLSDSFDRMTDDLKQAQQEILKQRLYEKELEVAGKIQAALLPSGPPHIEGFEVSALSAPARVVGGDFYDYVELGDGRIALLVADVAGKGLSAGLVMAAARSAARSAFAFTSSPHAALSALNAQLLRDFDRTTFVTMLCMVLDPAADTLCIANAGHPPVLWFKAANGSAEVVRTHGVALGILPAERFGPLLETVDIQLEPGDVVLGYSDGVNESHNVNGELFGEMRLRRFAETHAALDPQGMLTALQSELERFARGFGQFDDITALALKAAAERRGAARLPQAMEAPAGDRGVFDA